MEQILTRFCKLDMQVFTAWQTAVLSFQSLGIVYGDLGTSPLYVFPSVVLPGADERDFLGILSIILWTLTLISLVKYVLVVLRADDHGEGGTFALYSLICRRVRAGLLPGGGGELAVQPREGAALRLSRVRAALERHRVLQKLLLLLALLGTCMVIGDGVLTPAVSGRRPPPPQI
jgi:KUP system potassium uptake protein